MLWIVVQHHNLLFLLLEQTCRWVILLAAASFRVRNLCIGLCLCDGRDGLITVDGWFVEFTWLLQSNTFTSLSLSFHKPRISRRGTVFFFLLCDWFEDRSVHQHILCDIDL